jgi:hypothetical protein
MHVEMGYNGALDYHAIRVETLMAVMQLPRRNYLWFAS